MFKKTLHDNANGCNACTPSPDHAEIPGLDAFAETLRPYVLGLARAIAHIVASSTCTTPRIVTKANCSEWGFTPRSFADAARRGDFPSFKVGRTLAAHREAVEAYLRRRERVPRKAPPSVSTYQDLLRHAGLQQGGRQ